MADRAPMMDSPRLADYVADLNLKFMRWRTLPALNLQKLAKTRWLLLSMCTLGCATSRARS
ncbi:hypothetical protein OBBRIDRAFT_799668 [Obba rivulosa]|uniref:Uncharacterized protein n=1 Tax=Obba rivulosa TaxID=1052685 RepID=A0A8E2DDF4_9APHY|nr:hypothetical protein OBBRIDRAFT_799668 [Obba rivulosa]